MPASLPKRRVQQTNLLPGRHRPRRHPRRRERKRRSPGKLLLTSPRRRNLLREGLRRRRRQKRLLESPHRRRCAPVLLLSGQRRRRSWRGKRRLQQRRAHAGKGFAYEACHLRDRLCFIARLPSFLLQREPWRVYPKFQWIRNPFGSERAVRSLLFGKQTMSLPNCARTELTLWSR